MPTFEFKDHRLDLTIAGNAFTVNCITDLADKSRRHRDTLVKLGAEIAEGRKTNDDAINACEEITDDILGAGAFAAIFKGRTPNVTDCSDVLLFVMREITEYFKKNSGNRESRRATTKKTSAGAKK